VKIHLEQLEHRKLAQEGREPRIAAGLSLLPGGSFPASGWTERLLRTRSLLCFRGRSGWAGRHFNFCPRRQKLPPVPGTVQFLLAAARRESSSWGLKKKASPKAPSSCEAEDGRRPLCELQGGLNSRVALQKPTMRYQVYGNPLCNSFSNTVVANLHVG